MLNLPFEKEINLCISKIFQDIIKYNFIALTRIPLVVIIFH